jgi:uroporphyrinogen decarboxylase
MTPQERFIKTMHFESVDRIPYWVPVLWSETIEKWQKEGHPYTDEDAEEKLFECDHKEHVRMWLNFEPPFEENILGSDADYLTIQTPKGVVEKVLKNRPRDSQISFPLEYPIKNRDDYLKYRSRLTGNIKERMTKVGNLDKHKIRDYTVSLRGSLDCGFYGPLRDLVGFECLNYLFYDDPILIEMMMDDRAELIIQMSDNILEKTTIDWFCFWEDMAYKTGPMISPEMFRKFMMPRYRLITDYLHKRGIDLIFVDSDGDISQLIPLWLECGVNGMWPFEVQAGMDVITIRKKFGKDLLLIGGLDKRELAKGKTEIEREILKKVPPLIKEGGYIPRPDHSIPPDVSYDNYKYFMEFLRKIIEE